MKKQIVIALLLMLPTIALFAQDEFKPSGSGIGTVFFNYKYDLTEDVDKKSSFNLERAYLGYKYDFAKNLSGKVIFDIGYDGTTKAFTAFAKNAYLDWTMCSHFKLSVGLIPVKHFDLQEKMWGYRYIIKPVADEYGMGTTADLGLNGEITVNEMLSFNAYIINGEGFKNIQDPFGMHKYGVNGTLKPVEGLAFRLHYDMMPNKFTEILPDESEVVSDTSTISVFSAFIGYEKKDVFRVGFDYNMMNNATKYTQYADGYKLNAFSIFGTYIFNPNWEIFARYDNVSSNELDGETQPWNVNDGSMVMGGIQYRPIKNINFALNYRTFMYKEDEGRNNPSAIYLNLGMFF